MFSRSAADACALALAFSTARRTRPQKSGSQDAVKGRLKWSRCRRLGRHTARIALGDGRTRSDGGIVIGAIPQHKSAGGSEQRFGLLHAEVVQVDPFLKLVEFGIVENFPPFAFIETIARRGCFPFVAAGEFLEGGGAGTGGC